MYLYQEIDDREGDELFILMERDKQSSEWEGAVPIEVAKQVAKQMKKLKYCSTVLADHTRTYNTMKGKIPTFHYT